jgi:tetratricopeptide (TPR) repeat protein
MSPAACFSAAAVPAGAVIPQRNVQAAAISATAAESPQSQLARDVMLARPNYTMAEKYIMAGDRYFKANYFANALKYFFAAAKLEPRNINAWKKTAFCYYQLKQHNYAYAVFQRVLKLDANDKDALEFMEYYKTIIDKSKRVPEKREMGDSLWRSAVLPGFGQFYNNQGSKGIVIGGTFLVSLGLAIYSTTDERAKYQKYIQANENQDIAFKEAQDAYDSALIWAIIAGVAYAGAVIDAGINYNCDEARSITMDIREGTVCLAANFRW